MPEEEKENPINSPLENETDKAESPTKKDFPLKDFFDQALEHAKELRKKYSEEQTPEKEE
ncbi:MAG: hypothetical protein ACHQM6_04680 [Candidatus Kapaibacterium sp.]